MTKRRYINTENGCVFLDERFFNAQVHGSGLSVYGLDDGTEVICRRLTDDEMKSLDKKPVVAISPDPEPVFMKFISYIDIWPESATSYSKDVWMHSSDSSTFSLPHAYDIDPSGFSTFYTKNHSILKRMTRLEFISLCTRTLSEILRTGAVDDFDVHRMALCCVCYGNVFTYRIIPSESMSAKVDFVFSGR